tara:strand:- start:491 stop:709 length:219 start_codon:yes stop_codon:yes gene_type:complete
MPDNNYNYGKDYIMSSDKIKADRPDAPLTRMKPDFTPEIKEGDENPIIQAVPTAKSAPLDKAVLNADKQKAY